MPTSDLLTAGHDRQRLDTVVRLDRRSRRPLILIIGYAAAAPVSLLPVSLNGDIRYEVGAQTTSPTGASGTFTHRPLLYRLVAGLLLWSGIRRRHREPALPVAVAVTAALVLVNPGLTLERDWLAVLTRAAAVGFGLVTGRRRCRQDRHHSHRTHRPDHPAPATCCPA